MKLLPLAIRLPLVFVALVAAPAFGCGGTEGAEPEDMSAAAHRQQAAGHEREAEQHEAQYDPNATQVDPAGPSRGEFDFGEVTYNPTAHHRNAAERHREHAEAHRAAAEALEQYEEAECGSFPPSTRSACPLLGQVESTEEVDQGIRIRFTEGVRRDAVATHIRCHIAFGRTQGREGMDRCPLYIKGVHAEQMDSGAVELTVEDQSRLAELRNRTITHVVE